MWFGAPVKESFWEELAADTIAMKDRRGRVIGVEKLNYLSRNKRAAEALLRVEVQML